MNGTKDTQHPKVEIAVKNFGPIAEANIDLRPLTVFVGPSNTGKTYFATLVYALHGVLAGFPRYPLLNHALFSLPKAMFGSDSFDDVQNGLVGVPMELKGGGVDASEVIVQLQEGARIVDNLVPKDVNINLVLVLVHGGNMHKSQRNKLKTARIKFRNEEFPINTTTCSYQGNLAEALAKSTKR